MKKIIIIYILLLSILNAETIKANYEISFGVFGEIGQAEISYKHDNNTYLILVHAYSTGMASVMSGNREESYISQGKIIDGILIPDVFVKFRKTNGYVKAKVFLFEHDVKKIYEHKTREDTIYSTKYDVHTMKNVKVCTTDFSYGKKDFRLYTDNDILSLFFNTQNSLTVLKDGDIKKYTAVGSKNDGCDIDIKVPAGELKKELKEVIGNDGKLISIVIHQDIFQSENGELHVSFDKNGFAKNVLLKDVGTTAQ